MMKVTEIFTSRPRTYSFEFFPPKSAAGMEHLLATAAELDALGPDFDTVTYGAGGSTSTKTLELVVALQQRFGRPVVHHLTSMRQNRKNLLERLEQLRVHDVPNVLAMRGDPPLDEPHYCPSGDEPRFGYELVKLIAEHDGFFAVGVPGFPEGHVRAPSLELDARYLKVKQDAGAQFVITQLFFENDMYRRYVDRCRQAGVTMRIIPGILPITDYAKLADFCGRCGASVPESIRRVFEPIAGDPAAVYKRGLEVVTAQCQDLLYGGAPGLHFFCLNKAEPVATIFKSIGE